MKERGQYLLRPGRLQVTGLYTAEVSLTLIKWLQEGPGFAEMNWEEQILSAVTNLLPRKLVLKVRDSDGCRHRQDGEQSQRQQNQVISWRPCAPSRSRPWTSLLVGGRYLFSFSKVIQRFSPKPLEEASWFWNTQLETPRLNVHLLFAVLETGQAVYH